MGSFKICACGDVHPLKYECPIVKRRRNKRFDKYKSNTDRTLRSSYAWRKKSLEIRKATKHLCQVCMDKGELFSVGQPVEVHHITRVRDNINLLLDNSNLCVLCKRHHEQAEQGELSTEYLQRLAKERIKEKGI